MKGTLTLVSCVHVTLIYKNKKNVILCYKSYNDFQLSYVAAVLE